MASFRPEKDLEEFLNGFENKSELINYLLRKAKSEYLKSKVYFEAGLSTLAASRLEAQAMKVQIECKNEFDLDLSSPIDRRILKELEE